MEPRFAWFSYCLGVLITMKIFVVDLYQKSYTIDNITDSTTVTELKYRLEDKAGLPVDQQRIIFKGFQLEDGKTLASYGVEDGSKLTLVLRLIGD